MTTYAIPNGRTVMDATLYNGNGTTGQSISNAFGFKPDLVWVKGRNAAINNVLEDSVRGVSKSLFSDGTYAEINASPYGVTAFNSNGFSVLDTNPGDYGVNGASGGTYSGTPPAYVAWQWQAGQGSNTTNTTGTITSTVSANATAGFSICTFTAQGSGNGTVGHGLNAAPSVILCKQRGSSGSWSSYFAILGNTKYLNLNTNGAAQTDTTAWNSTSPTSSVFTLGSFWAGAGTMVSYCWTPIDGFSSFGSFVGNASTNGPFIYTGFRPKFVIFKASSTGGTNYDWFIEDSTRSPYNQVGLYLNSNLSDAEQSNSNFLDFLSNGFKMRSGSTYFNGSGITFIYMAFAENPFKYANAR